MVQRVFFTVAAVLFAAQVACAASSITVNWTDDATGEAGFKIQKQLPAQSVSWVDTATVGANVTTWTDTNIVLDQQNCYRVIAYTTTATAPPSNSTCQTPSSFSGGATNATSVINP